jgi:hypothetical protein
MASSTIVCFDLNSSYEEGCIVTLEENKSLLESPLRIFDEFMETHLFLEAEKTCENSTKIAYNFRFSNDDSNSFEIITLSDLSYVHNISLESDGYLVFLNLEDQKTIELLEKIIKYVISCSMEIKTYIVGLYKDKILPILDKESLDSYLDDKNLDYEYYQIKYENNNRNGFRKSHICINNYLLNKVNNNKGERKIGNLVRTKDVNNYENYNLTDIIELIFIQTYTKVEYNDKRKIIKDYLDYDAEKSFCTSGNCYIY